MLFRSLLLPTSSAGIIANLAVLLRGRTVVNLNYTSSREALTASVTSAGIKHIYTSRKFVEKLAQRDLDPSAVFSISQIHYLEDLVQGITPQYKLFMLLLARLLPAWTLRMLFCKRVDIETPAAILFSSGSEGVPKGVMLTHRNLVANLCQCEGMAGFDAFHEEDSVIAVLPVFHIYGMVVIMMLALEIGRAHV